MLVCACIRYVTANQRSTRRYLDMSRLGDTMQSTDRKPTPDDRPTAFAQDTGHNLQMNPYLKFVINLNEVKVVWSYI